MTDQTLKITTNRFTFDDVSQRVKAYQDLFDTPNGQAVLFDLMSLVGFYDHKPSDNPNQAIYREGVRSAIMRILDILSVKEIQSTVQNNKILNY